MQDLILIDVHLTTKDLARRWHMTPHTLGQWRWKGHGPRFFKLGGQILYRHEEIEKFECTGVNNTHVEAYAAQLSTADAEDPRFLCINLELLIATKEEEKEMETDP